MGHESRIELWLPLTTVLLVSFRANWLRREGSDENRREKQPNSLGRHVQRLREWHGRSEPTLFKYVGLEARETPAVGKIFSLDFPLYRTTCRKTLQIRPLQVSHTAHCSPGLPLTASFPGNTAC